MNETEWPAVPVEYLWHDIDAGQFFAVGPSSNSDAIQDDRFLSDTLKNA